MKATLLSYGYTVTIKFTAMKKQHLENYCNLRKWQGQQIPVYIGAFKPHIAYWYHDMLWDKYNKTFGGLDAQEAMQAKIYHRFECV